MEILGFIFVLLVVYNVYFFYNVVVLLPKRNYLYMKLPFCSKVWEIRIVGSNQPVVQYTDTIEDSVEDDEPEELEGSLADDELDFKLTKRIDEEDFNIGYKDGYEEGMKDGRQEGYAEGFQNGCENSECGPLVADLVHELIDRKEFSMAAWLTTELDNMD
jgi:flagellar biosynthesis/type III secretory pathway protein FliH